MRVRLGVGSSLVLLALAALPAGCNSSSVSHGDAAVATDDAAPPDAIAPSDAAAGDLWEAIFGPNDPALPGRACQSLRDDCRGSTRAYVCADDAGDQVGEGLTCRACTTDAQCGWEYPYWNSLPTGSSVICGTDGQCHPQAGEDARYCEPGGGWCRTARSGYYVCGAPSQCERCTTDDECRLEYYGAWYCMLSGPAAGQCVEVPQL